MALSRDGRRSLWGGSDGELVLWDMVKHHRVRQVGTHPVTSTFMTSPSSQDGRRAATVGEGSFVRIWDVDEGKELTPLTGHDGPKGCVAVSQDGRRLAIGGIDNEVCVWDLARRPASSPIPDASAWQAETRVAFSTDGKLASTSHEAGEVVLWRTSTRANCSVQSKMP